MPVSALVDLDARRRGLRLRAALEALGAWVAAAPLPTPEALGWLVTARDEAGRPIEVACPRYGATAAYVAGRPELVTLEYRGDVRAYALGLEELLVGLEAGCLPDPVTA